MKSLVVESNTQYSDDEAREHPMQVGPPQVDEVFRSQYHCGQRICESEQDQNREK